MKKYLLLAGFVIMSGYVLAQSEKLIAQKSGSGAVLVHEVQSGEGLYSLADAYDISISEIAKANNFESNQNLLLGQKVKIPLSKKNLSARKGKFPIYYETSSNKESLKSISKRFNNATVKDLKAWNKISGDDAPSNKSIIVGYLNGSGTASNTSKAKSIGQVTVQGSNINIRKSASTNGDIVGIAQQDDVLEILKKVNNEWTSVRNKDGVEGYVASQFLRPVENKTSVKTQSSNAKAIGEATVSGTDINIRKGPSTNEGVAGVAQLGQKVEVIKKVNNEWTSIRTQDGVEGFVSSQFLIPVEKKAPAKAERTKAKAIGTATISGTDINIRKGASTNDDVVGVAQLNEKVDIIKKVNNEWTSIRTRDGVEGYIASQFLQTGDKKVAKEVAKPTQTVTAYETRLNIRKGPSTSQEVVAMVEANEQLTYIRKVDSEWSEVSNANGAKGFVATRFLSFDNKPSLAAVEATAATEQAQSNVQETPAVNETSVAKTQEQESAEKAESIVSEKIAAKNNAETGALDDAGYFKNEYAKMVNPNLTEEKSFISGVFKTDRGWNDGKYYLLMDNVAPGTLVKLSNPDNNKMVYAKVLGKMKGLQYSNGFDIRISEAAAQKLQLGSDEKFNVMVTY